MHFEALVSISLKRVPVGHISVLVGINYIVQYGKAAGALKLLLFHTNEAVKIASLPD